jgi:hypothetical protein
VTFYRLYFLNCADRIKRAEDIPAPDDATALSLACDRLRHSDFLHGELWQRARKLSAFDLDDHHLGGCAGAA